MRTRPQWYVVIALGLWSLCWFQVLIRSLLYKPVPGGINWCEVAGLGGFVACGWLPAFAFCTVEEREYQSALTEIVAPNVVSRSAQ